MSPKRSDASTGSSDSAADAAGDIGAARDARETETAAPGGSAEECESDPIEVLHAAARTAKLLLGALVSALTALKLLGVL